jgi:hypothetical protein
LQNLRATHYVLAVSAAAFVFCLFIALELPVEGTPAKSLPIAGALCGFAAAAFSYVWPRSPWVWGTVLSGGFWAFLLVVFGAFLMNGQLELWPLVDALVIVTIAWTGAAAGRMLAQRPR